MRKEENKPRRGREESNESKSQNLKSKVASQNPTNRKMDGGEDTASKSKRKGAGQQQRSGGNPNVA